MLLYEENMAMAGADSADENDDNDSEWEEEDLDFDPSEDVRTRGNLI